MSMKSKVGTPSEAPDAPKPIAVSAECIASDSCSSPNVARGANLTCSDKGHFVYNDGSIIGAAWAIRGARGQFIAMNSRGKLGEFRSMREAEDAIIAAAKAVKKDR